MRSSRRAFLILAGFIAAFAPLVSQERAVSPVASITAEELRQHIFFLASDALGGRSLLSPGYKIAAEYGESQFRAAGVKPGARKGDQAVYFQDIPLVRRTPKADPILTITTPRGETPYVYNKDFKWMEGNTLPCENRNLPLISLGYGIQEPKLGWDDYQGLDLKGKAVLVWPGAPMKDGRPVLPEATHKMYSSPAGFNKKLLPLIGKGARAVFVVPEEFLLKAWDKLPAKNTEAMTVYDNPASEPFIPWICLVKEEAARAWTSASGTVPRGDIAGVSLAVSGSFEEERQSTVNVVGVVEGTDPVLKSEWVAVTAHLDHRPVNAKGEIFNGADDNASGSAAVLEIAEAAAMKPFKRSVVFVLFAAEESGLLGSMHFAAACPVPFDKIVADVNLDMIGRSDPASETDRAIYAFDTDKVTPAFKNLLVEVNDRTVRWPLKFDRVGNAAGFGSDNMVFDPAGIPSVFFSSGAHADYHRVTDDAEKIDYEKTWKVTQLAYDLTAALADGAPLKK